MINIVYFGAGSYYPPTGIATYKIVLPSLPPGQVYAFPAIYNFSKGGTNRILIHMHVTGITPDEDLSEMDLKTTTMVTVPPFNINNLNSPGNFTSPREDIDVIVYHDDQFSLEEAKAKFYVDEIDLCECEKMLKNKSITVPRKSGLGMLKKF